MRNKTIVEDLLLQRKDFIFIAEFSVTVPNDVKTRKHGGEIRIITRKIIIIDVAANYLRDFAQTPLMDMIMRLSEDSSRTLFAVSHLFRSLLKPAMVSSEFKYNEILSLEGTKCYSTGTYEPQCKVVLSCPGSLYAIPCSNRNISECTGGSSQLYIIEMLKRTNVRMRSEKRMSI